MQVRKKHASKAFVRTIEAVFAGAMILIYFSTLSLQPPEIMGFEAKKIREVSTLLAVATLSNASDVFLYGEYSSSAALMSNLLYEPLKIGFELGEIPKKKIRVGYWVEDFFTRNVVQSPGQCVSKCPGLSGRCGQFQLDTQDGCLNNYTYIVFDYDGDGDYGDENPITLHQVFTPPGSTNRYMWEKYVISGNVDMYFMNLSKMREISQKITNSFILNERESTIYFVPVCNETYMKDLDDLVIINKTSFTDEEIKILADFIHDGGGVVWVADVDGPAGLENILELLGLRWVNTNVVGSDGDVIVNPRLLKAYRSTHEFSIYLTWGFYEVGTISVGAVVPAPIINCIPNSGTAKFGILTLSRSDYPFILVYDGTEYSTLYIDYDDDYNFCEVPDSNPIHIGEWFNVSDTNRVIFGEAERMTGSRAYFGLNTSHHYADFTNVGAGGNGKNRIYPASNESAYAVLVSNTKTYDVNGVIRNVAAAIFNEVNGTYRVAWIPSSLVGADEWKLVRDAIIWTSKKEMVESTQGLEHKTEIEYPIIWHRNTTFIGSAEVKIW